MEGLVVVGDMVGLDSAVKVAGLAVVGDTAGDALGLLSD
jgi:hypothetical protein